MKLYVMRHGETITNTMHLISGNKEADLTKRGIKQAKEAKKHLQDIDFDYVFASPLSRARITASTVSDKSIIIDKRLIERDYGNLDMKRKADVNYDGFWNYNLNLDYNGENIRDLLKRVENLIQDLKNEYLGKNILLVTHSGVARAIHYYITGIPQDGDLTKLEIPNCSVRVYEIKKEVE